jgi:hypothetical protein
MYCTGFRTLSPESNWTGKNQKNLDIFLTILSGYYCMDFLNLYKFEQCSHNGPSYLPLLSFVFGYVVLA